MKKILVPFDFSKKAISAFRFAVDIASQSKGTVHLLHVMELPVINDPVIMPVIPFEQDFYHAIRNRTNRNLQKVIAKHAGDVIVHKNTEFGSPTKMINAFAEKEGMDLIVMGSNGASGLKEVFIGSNAEKVVRSSSVPVLVLKNKNNRPIRNIVFPNTLHLEKLQDFTAKVKALQHFFKAIVHIVYINTQANFISDTVTLARLKEFAKRFMFKDFTLNVFNHHSEEAGIMEFAKSIKGDIIAMGTHGRKGISHLINGSLTENIVNRSNSLIWSYNLTLEEKMV